MEFKALLSLKNGTIISFQKILPHILSPSLRQNHAKIKGWREKFEEIMFLNSTWCFTGIFQNKQPDFCCSTPEIMFWHPMAVIPCRKCSELPCILYLERN